MKPEHQQKIIHENQTLLCDKTIGTMVRKGILKDGPCESGETEDYIGLVTIGYLFKKVQKIIDKYPQ